MQITVSEAKQQLLDLVRRAEKGEDTVLTRHGRPVARLVGLVPDMAERRAAIEEARGTASSEAGTTAARSQDFLYDDEGLPA